MLSPSNHPNGLLLSAREPTVSVVMAVYNGEEYLSDAIESILGQTFRDFEFIIIDDGSNDRSATILAETAAQDDRIRVFRQENAGLTTSLVRGIDLSRGRLIARMDADDISCPTRLEKQVQFFQAHPGIELVSSKIEFMDEGGNKRFEVAPLHFPNGCIAFFMPFFNVMAGHGQVMYSRKLYDQVNGYNPSFRFAQDYDLWERMSHHTAFGQIDEVLYRFRTSANSITKKNWAGQQECRARVSARSYERLTGRALDDETLRLVNEFWHGSGIGALGVSDLVRVDRAQRRALEAWNPQSRPRHELAAVKKKVAEQFVKHGARIAIRKLPKFMVYHMFAARWDRAISYRALRDRLYRGTSRKLHSVRD